MPDSNDHKHIVLSSDEESTIEHVGFMLMLVTTASCPVKVCMGFIEGIAHTLMVQSSDAVTIIRESRSISSEYMSFR